VRYLPEQVAVIADEAADQERYRHGQRHERSPAETPAGR
jgi:hypothetical protein